MLPVGASIYVTRSPSGPNFTYTITFLDLSASAAKMTFTSNLLNKSTGTAGTGNVTAQTFTRPQGSISVAASSSTFPRLVLSGDNNYSGTTTINSGILQAASDTALGTAAGGTIVNGGVLELAGAHIGGESLILATTTTSQVGLFDQGSTVQVSRNNSADALVNIGSGGLRAVSGDSSWTGPITLSSSPAAGENTFGITVNDAASLDISGVIGASNGGNSLFKQGNGTLTYSGQSSNTMTGTTYVQQGTLVLNKQGTANAIQGDLVIGDGRGGADPANADKVTYGPLAGGDQIIDGKNLFVRSTGQYDLRGAHTYSSELQLLTFGANASITLSLFGLTANVAALGVDAATTAGAMQLAFNAAFGADNLVVTALIRQTTRAS